MGDNYEYVIKTLDRVNPVLGLAGTVFSAEITGLAAGASAALSNVNYLGAVTSAALAIATARTGIYAWEKVSGRSRFAAAAAIASALHGSSLAQRTIIVTPHNDKSTIVGEVKENDDSAPVRFSQGANGSVVAHISPKLAGKRLG